jgi:hypothetical protein
MAERWSITAGRAASFSPAPATAISKHWSMNAEFRGDDALRFVGDRENANRLSCGGGASPIDVRRAKRWKVRAP